MPLIPLLVVSVVFGLAVSSIVLLILRIVHDPGSALRGVVRVIVAVVVVGAVLFAVAAVAYVSVPQVGTRVVTAPSEPAPSADRPAWLDAGEYLAASADVHPSRATALRALAAKLDEVIEPPHVGGASSPVRLFGDADALTRQAFAAELRARAYNVVADAEQPGTIDVRLEEVGVDPAGERGEFWAAMDEELLSTRWIEKPWVEDLERYREATGTGSARESAWDGFLAIAQSASPAVTEAEALELAYRDAAERLAARIGGPGPWERRPELASRFEAELREGRFIADRFVQRFERPSGDVYRALLLVDAPGESLTEVVSGLAVRERRHGSSVGGSLVGLVVLVTGVYLALRLVTARYDRVPAA